MDKIKNQLAGVAALLGVIAAIGGGFVKYGEVMTKLEVLEAKESADYSSQIAVLEEKVEALSVQHGHTKILVCPCCALNASTFSSNTAICEE